MTNCKRCGKPNLWMPSFTFPASGWGMHQLEIEVCHDCVGEIVDLYLLAHFNPITGKLHDNAAKADTLEKEPHAGSH